MSQLLVIKVQSVSRIAGADCSMCKFRFLQISDSFSFAKLFVNVDILNISYLFYFYPLVQKYKGMSMNWEFGAEQLDWFWMNKLYTM